MLPDERTSVVRQTERGIRYGILAVLVVGLRQRNPGAVANAAVAFLCTLLPTALERRYDVELRPWQRLYVKSALLTHSVGMLGPYDDVWWWDHLTHLLSASVLGGAVHVAARRRGRVPHPRVFGVVVTMGVLWELMEYAIHTAAARVGMEPVLIPYGRYDTALDLVFDMVGALLVVVFGDRLLRNLVGDAAEPSRLES